MENMRIHPINRGYGRLGIFRMLSITNLIIILDILVFLFVILFSSIIGEEKIASLLALQANSFFSGKIWTLFTSMFMHANIGHLLFNMISLFFIGNFVEKLIGRKRFFWFYLLSGIFAGLFYVCLSYFFGNVSFVLGDLTVNLGEKLFLSPSTYAVGASGAIFALVGLLAVLTPYNKVYLIAGPLIAIIIEAFLISAFPDSGFVDSFAIVINIYFVLSILAMFSFNPVFRRFAVPLEMPLWLLPIVAIAPLVIIGLFVSLPIGNTAHIGGLIIGLGYAVYLRKKYKRKTSLIRKYFGG